MLLVINNPRTPVQFSSFPCDTVETNHLKTWNAHPILPHPQYTLTWRKTAPTRSEFDGRCTWFRKAFEETLARAEGPWLRHSWPYHSWPHHGILEGQGSDRLSRANEQNHLEFCSQLRIHKQDRCFADGEGWAREEGSEGIYLVKSSIPSTYCDTISSVCGSNFGIWARKLNQRRIADLIMTKAYWIADWTGICFSMQTIETRLK